MCSVRKSCLRLWLNNIPFVENNAKVLSHREWNNYIHFLSEWIVNIDAFCRRNTTNYFHSLNLHLNSAQLFMIRTKWYVLEWSLVYCLFMKYIRRQHKEYTNFCQQIMLKMKYWNTLPKSNLTSGWQFFPHKPLEGRYRG